MLTYIMESASSVLQEFPLWIFLVILVVFLYISKWVKNIGKKYPPGPKGLPILGYLPFLGENSHIELDKLRKTYGDIISIRWGMVDVVVLSDFRTLKEAFNKEEVTDRPSDILRFSSKKEMEHMGTMNPKDWRESRKFTLSTFRALGVGKNKMEEDLMEAVQNLVDTVAQSCGQPEVRIRDLIYSPINHMIISMVCGRTLSADPEFSKTVDDFSRDVLAYLDIHSLGFYIPLLKPFLSLLKPKLRKFKSSIAKMDQLMWKEISKHEEDMGKDSNDDYMDHFLGAMKKITGSPGTFTYDVLNATSQLFLLGGSDTTMKAIEWAILLFAQHPEEQERAYQEIVRVVGKERLPSWSEKNDLPYLDAFITEAARFKTIVPLAAPHRVRKEMNIDQYVIPVGTVVMGNLYSVNMDPRLWDKPEVFNPGRFLTPDGQRAKDPDFLIPFGIGKRICAGEKLARMQLFLILGAILQRFQILPPPSGLNLNSKLALVLYPVEPLVRFQARN